MQSFLFRCNCLLVSGWLLLLSAAFYSCNKIETPQQIYSDRFFQKPTDSSPGLLAIIDMLKKENEKNGFVNNLPANAGLPIWEKLILEKPKRKASQTEKGIITDKEGNMLIPLTNDSKTLSALLFVLKEKENLQFYYYDNNYAYQIAFGEKYSQNQKEYVLALFMNMSNYVFGIHGFKNIPKALFPGFGSAGDKKDILKEVFLVPVKETAPEIFTTDRVVGSITLCGYIWSGHCNCPENPNVSDPTQCRDWWKGCPLQYCSKWDCYTIVFEQEDPPIEPVTGSEGSSETVSDGTSGGSNSQGSGPLPIIASTGGLPDAPCNNCAWYTEAPEQKFEEYCGEGGILVDNECVSPSDYPGKEEGYPFKWWENEFWLQENFCFVIDNTGIKQGLTSKEIAFIKQHPKAAAKIRLNAITANDETEVRYPGPWPTRHNDKGDAFRHTYWMALNAWTLENAAFAREFGEAHESEVPPAKQLEKEMDLHNNEVGISVNSSLFYPTLQQIIDAVVSAILTGQCWYLDPVDESNHAILPRTELKPTNQ